MRNLLILIIITAVTHIQAQEIYTIDNIDKVGLFFYTKKPFKRINGLVNTHDNNGRLITQFHFKEGVLLSKKMFDKNKNVIFTMHYRKEKKYELAKEWEGSWIVYGEPKNRNSVYNKKEGKMHGPIAMYDNTTKKLVETQTYKAGLQDGPWKSFYPDGSLRETGSYKAGKKHGIQKLYSKKREVLQSWEYKNGEYWNGTWTYYHVNGHIKSKSSYKNGLREGDSIKYYPDGKILQKQTYKAGKNTGEDVIYTKSGKVFSKKRYNKQGIMIEHKHYKNYNEKTDTLSHTYIHTIYNKQGKKLSKKEIYGTIK